MTRVMKTQSWQLLGCCFVLIFSVLAPAIAGPVTIEAKEITALRALVSADEAAAAQYSSLKRLADEALLDTPRPVNQIISAGTLSSDPNKIRTREALQDMQKAEALAWAWVVSGDLRYAEKGRQYISAWARTNQPDGNAINETGFEPMIEAYDILRDSFDGAERAIIDQWLRRKVDLLWQDTQRQRENWQSHRLKIIGLIALTIRDAEMWAAVDQAYKRHIQTNFNAAGESIDFTRRDALHYHLYAIRPLLTLACASSRSGDNLFSYQAPNGASLPGAVDFLLPYTNKSKTHIEFVDSQVGFDKRRAKAGEPEYQPHPWNPKSATVVYTEAACLNPAYAKLATQVSEQPGKKYINWRSVLNAVAPAVPAR